MPSELEDPWHNNVILTAKRKSYILEHPEMAGQEQKITETIKHPDVIVQSRSDETVRLFHRYYQGLSIGDKHLCVVVKYTEENIFIITAYFTDKVKRGEVLWEK
jgi:hypothetical protein